MRAIDRSALGTGCLWYASIVLSALLGFPLQLLAESPASRRIVLITIDTLRYDSVFGSGDEVAMPRLRAWAEGATVFDRCYSASASTQPSHASMLTGLHPWEHGVTGNTQRLSADVPTVATRFQQAGYSTAAIVASFPLAADFGFDRGFDQFDDRFELGVVRGVWQRGPSEKSGDDPESSEAARPFYSLAESVASRASALLRIAVDGNRFLWFHFFDPHTPYGDAAGVDSTTTPLRALHLVRAGKDPTDELSKGRALYDADLRALDESLSSLLSDLDVGDGETHIMIAADHGESFGEHGSVAHGRRLIESQIKVPCVIKSPDAPPGRRSDVAGSVDLAVTLLSFGDLEEGLERTLRGRDLTQPAKPGATAVGMRRTYRAPYEDTRLDGSVVIIDGRLFYDVDPNGILRRGNARGLVTLAGEPEPAYGETARLMELFATFEKALERVSEPTPLDPDEEEALRALGYVP